MMKIYGCVSRGLKTGRKIGFPTINIFTEKHNLGFGVYACEVFTGGKFTDGKFAVCKFADGNTYKGAMHYGPKKIVGQDEPSMEIHLLNFSGDLYGREVTIKVYKKIRDTKDFNDFESLKIQIEMDVKQVKQFFKEDR